ncbi:hypothetical protein UFOVP998_2 [uncultured Caudovirales phage]|uniref:PKD domain-containing protein n=1 Tax=uncultured Caudovirales phage TaxID=2100421 RepID=A0A6J5SF81_9CAUD|nr:hypothetical protein UFOVP998_2 [uncultured Caudovirales phage]CAB4199535.1 hypothetical protein UFOVP1331_57 [uncultured Caudovirales phage]CAB4212673.1 hypothetical protein UFOVP1442_18 [uncultured Caudovirales phage]CAB5228051.1 hypothetical protein UFOVP1535_33 [uncultured Caudovirales phage]
MLQSRRGRQNTHLEHGHKSRKSLIQRGDSLSTLSPRLPSSPICNHVSITLFATVLALAGCAYETPTAPTASASAPAATVTAQVVAPAIARFEVTPTIAPGGRTVTLVLRAWDETGRSLAFAATCAASSGDLNPRRVVGNGTGLAEWTGAAPTTGTATCTAEGFDRPATAVVDLSAWTTRIAGFNERLDEQLRWRTYASAVFDPIGQTYPALVRTVSWGDGSTELLPGHLQTGPGMQSLSHLYARAGDYEVKVRVEWSGGSAESRYRLNRTCSAQPPGAPTYPEPATSFGYCQNTFWELR